MKEEESAVLEESSIPEEPAKEEAMKECLEYLVLAKKQVRIGRPKRVNCTKSSFYTWNILKKWDISRDMSF